MNIIWICISLKCKTVTSQAVMKQLNVNENCQDIKPTLIFTNTDLYMWHTWTCDTQNIFRELNMCNQPISRICGKPDLLSMQTWGNTVGLQVIDDVYCLKFPPYVFVPHVMWIRLNNKLWGLVKAPNSNIQVLVYVLFTVISMLAKVLGLTRSRTRWQALTLKSFY